ncbi:P-type conjugative transfer protein TrbL [Desulfovibrio falkowii]
MNGLTHFFKLSISAFFLIVMATTFISVSSPYDCSSAHAATSAQSGEQDVDILGKIASKYYEKANSWGNQLEDFAKRLFKWFLLADILMFGIAGGIAMAAGGKNIGQVIGELTVSVIIPAAFMFCVIEYYQQWSSEIIKGMGYIAGTVEPKSAIGASSFFKAGINLFDGIWSAFTVTDPSTWPLILAGIVLIVVYALMAMKILLIKCESYIVLNAGIIILGLGAFSQTRSYAVNFITYVLSVAVKLYVMQLIIGIAFSFVDEFLATPPDMNNSIVILGASIVMLGLLSTIPDMCAGIIQGQHVGSGNALASAMGAFTGAVAGTISAAGTAGATANAVKSVAAAATEQGLSGGAKAGYVARQVANAAWGTNATTGESRGTFTGRMNSRMQKHAGDILQKKNSTDGTGDPTGGSGNA